MNLSSIDNFQPEQVMNSEQKPIVIPSAQVSANALVGRSLASKKVKIKHLDGVTVVLANAKIKKGEVEFNYRFDKMSYGQTLSLKQCIERGYVKKVMANNDFREMKQGVVYPIVKFTYAEDDFVCNKGDMLVKIPVTGGAHISNFEAAF